MSTITITIEAYDMKHQMQFSDNRVITIDDALGEMYKILALLDFTPQTIADVAWQEAPYLQGGDDTDDIRIMDLEEQVASLQEKLDRITADNLFDNFAPLARVDSAVTINRNRLQEALDKCLGRL